MAVSNPPDNFSIDRFLERMAGLSKQKMLAEAEKALHYSQAHLGMLARKRRKVNDGSENYCRVVEEFLFFLRTLKKPNSVYDAEFSKFKPVVESLIDENEAKPELLRLFESKV